MSDGNQNSFGERLQTFRLQHGWTQEKLAQVLSFNQPTINRWEREKKVPNLDDINLMLHEAKTSSEITRSEILMLLNLQEVHEYNGIRWMHRIPDHLPLFQQEIVKHGIELFEELIRNPDMHHDLDNLMGSKTFSDDSLPKLYSTFQATLSLGAITILDIPRDEEKEKQLKNKYNLRKVIVASVPHHGVTPIRTEYVSFLAARDAFMNLNTEGPIGIGGGYTLFRMIAQGFTNATQFAGVTWLPLVSFQRHEDGTINPYSANYIANTLAGRFRQSSALYLPYAQRDKNDQYVTETSPIIIEQIDNFIEQTRQALVAFITVNHGNRQNLRGINYGSRSLFAASADFRHFPIMQSVYDLMIHDKNIEQQFAGELNGLVLNDNAQRFGPDILREENNRASFQVDLALLKNIVQQHGHVYLLAARKYKCRAVDMVLRNDLANCLITDTEIATELLKD